MYIEMKYLSEEIIMWRLFWYLLQIKSGEV